MTPTRKSIGWTARRKRKADFETARTNWFLKWISECAAEDRVRGMTHNWGLSAAEKREFGA